MLVKAWHDIHGDAMFFLVVNEAGKEHGRFASEVEAEKFIEEQPAPPWFGVPWGSSLAERKSPA